MPSRRPSDAGSAAESLVLFFTRGVSLATWEERGILDREVALYRALADRLGWPVSFVTYGDSADLGFAERLGPGITVLPNGSGLPRRAYNQLLPLVHRPAFRNARVLKTNQVYGGIAALRAARLYRRPLVARCGFLWSEVAEADHGPRSLRARFVRNRERRLLRGADIVVVTTPRLRERVRERHGVPEDRIAVIPNYVDIARFVPGDGADVGALVFVGRLAREKNLEALIEAVAGLDGVSLTIVGDGPMRPGLERWARDLRAEVRFEGQVPHERLPALLSQASAFVLPSLYEGHPKAAVEAMACGLPVVGTDVDGVRDLVREGETGVLCGTSASELRTGIERVLGDPALRERLARGARAAADDVSLERVVELEAEVLERAARIGAAE